MSDKEVNGWSNRETWLVGLWMNDTMFEHFKEQKLLQVLQQVQ